MIIMMIQVNLLKARASVVNVTHDDHDNDNDSIDKR